MFFQAHDIIVVELAPPPPRETNGEEADPAVDAEAVAAALPKVPEKKKVYYGSDLIFLRPLPNHSSLQEPDSHSTLHIKKEQERDYMGRSWLEAIPADLRYCSYFVSCSFIRAVFSALFPRLQSCGGRRYSGILSAQNMRTSVGGTHEGRDFAI